MNSTLIILILVINMIALVGLYISSRKQRIRIDELEDTLLACLHWLESPKPVKADFWQLTTDNRLADKIRKVLGKEQKEGK